jgi:hypothetical protein
VDIIKKYGYPVEKHPVTTEDGYTLELHRIPFTPKSGASPKKSPVFLMHGLFACSADWIVMGPEKSLGKSHYICIFFIGNAIVEIVTRIRKFKLILNQGLSLKIG